MKKAVTGFALFCLSMSSMAAASPVSNGAQNAPKPAVVGNVPDLSSVGMNETVGCLEGPMAQFGRYLGDWDIQDMTLQKDGSGWVEGKGARWNFTCVGNGTVIQDFWMPNGGGFGTNLRTYNANEDRWDIFWAFAGMTEYSHISAEQNAAGDIVMNYVTPIPSPLRRITFFTPDANGWDWKQEMSMDDGATWFDVYRIKATRRK